MLLATLPVPENGLVNTIAFEREKNSLFVGAGKCKVPNSFLGWQSSFPPVPFFT